jgi:Fe-S cluster assembly scaffold protein SufB
MSNRAAEGGSTTPAPTVEVALGTWEVSESLKALFFWISHDVVTDFTERGYTFRGLSAKYQHGTVLLVIKAVVEERRVVAFFTGTGLREAIEIFYSKFSDSVVRWVLDRY